MMKVVLLSVLMMVSMAAEAEWTYVATSVSGEVFFIDFSTFKRTKEGYRRVWELLDASKGKKSFRGNTYKSIKTLVVFDCDDERSRPLTEILFSGELGGGEVMSSLDGPGSWDYPAPGSIAKAMLNAVCSRR